MDELTRDAIRRAAEAIASADALLIGAGAGMGVDSGLPDFRGREGFWRAYPPYARLGLGFTALADPRWFRDDPRLAWGFYGHRLNLYRETEPHAGFAILRRWAGRMPLGAFVYTSNVDGQFQRAGFDPDRVGEVHGSIHHLQCTSRCGVAIFEADGCEVEVDPTTMRAVGPLPRCPSCGALARPNILMFGDGDWDDSRSSAQRGDCNGGWRPAGGPTGRGGMRGRDGDPHRADGVRDAGRTLRRPPAADQSPRARGPGRAPRPVARGVGGPGGDRRPPE